jgi:hypothetical protein
MHEGLPCHLCQADPRARETYLDERRAAHAPDPALLGSAGAGHADRLIARASLTRSVQGNVVSPGVNEFIIPNYKQTWANIRKLAATPAVTRHLSFKSREYRFG